MYEIQVYTMDGRIYTYEIASPLKVIEHASAIIDHGYRHNDGKVFEHYPPHRILKVKCEAAIPTKFPDKTTST